MGLLKPFQGLFFLAEYRESPCNLRGGERAV